MKSCCRRCHCSCECCRHCHCCMYCCRCHCPPRPKPQPGPPGPPGPEGPPGPQGEPGPAGQDGQDGQDGINGTDGKDGTNGITPEIGSNGHWWIGDIDTGVSAEGEKGEKGEKGDKGDKGDQGAIGPSPTLNYITATYNKQITYAAGDLLRFDSPTAPLARNGISLSANTTFTVASKTVYELSLSVEVLSIQSGQPRIQIIINGTPEASHQLNIRTTGWHAYDMIISVPANATIQFMVVNGGFTTPVDFSGLVHCATIKSLN